MEEAGVPGENHCSLRVKLEDRKRISEKMVGSAGIRNHALSDRGLLAQCPTTRPRRSPAEQKVAQIRNFKIIYLLDAKM